MALVAFASGRSHGLTTATLALATAWPRPRVLVEVDPDGGTIACWYGTSPDPGLATLAAAGRHYLAGAHVQSNLQELPNGVPVLMAPPSPDRTVAALDALNRVGLPEVLRDMPESDVLVDCGRIDSHSPALPLLRAGDAAIFVTRPVAVDIVGLQARLETLDLSSLRLRAGVVVVGGGPHTHELSGALRLPVVGTIDWDERGAAALHNGRRVSGTAKLLRSAARLAGDLVAQLPEPAAPPRRGQPEGAGAGSPPSWSAPPARTGRPSPYQPDRPPANTDGRGFGSTAASS